MAGGASLRFAIIGDASSAVKAMRRTQSEAEKSTTAIKGSFKKLAGLGAGLLAAGGIADFFKQSIAEASAYGKVTRQTVAVIKSTGAAAHVSAAEVAGLAKSIAMNTGMDKASIQTGENLLLTFTRIRNEVGAGNDIFTQATQIIADVSTALGQDTKSSAIQLGKALNDPTRGITALARVGVSFTAQQRAQVKAMQASGNMIGAQKLIIRELTTEFGGSAAAQATSGMKLKVAMSELRQQVGNALLPVMTALNKILMNDVVPALSATFGWVQRNASWLKPLAAAVLGLWVAYKGYVILRGVVAAFTLLNARYAQWVAQLSYGNAAQRGLSSALQGTTTGVGSLTGIIAGSVVIIGSAMYAWQAFRSEQQKAKDEVNSLTEAIKADSGALGENARAALVAALQQQKLKGLGISTLDLVEKAGQSGKEFVDALTKGGSASDTFMRHLKAARAQAQAIVSGDPEHLHEAEENKIEAIDHLVHEYDVQSGRVKQAVKDAKQYDVALDKSTKATTKQSSAAKEAAASIKKVAGAGLLVKTAIDQLSAAFDRLNGRTIDAAEADLAFRDSLVALDEALKGSNHSLSRSTVVGRAHLRAVFDSIKAAQADSEATLTRTHSAAQADRTYRRDIATIRNHMRHLGYDRDAIQRVIDRYAQLPAYKATKVDVRDYATDNLRAIRTYLDLLAKGVTIPVISKGGFSYLPGAATGGKGHAAGTNSAPAGWAWVGERGAELIRLRGGEKILSHPNSMKFAAPGYANGTGGGRDLQPDGRRQGRRRADEGVSAGGRVLSGTVAIDADSQGRLFARFRDVVLDELDFTNAIGRMRR